ncbi:MAG: hypothetical protein Q9170_002888 [Blastenia crenularia]
MTGSPSKGYFGTIAKKPKTNIASKTHSVAVLAVPTLFNALTALRQPSSCNILFEALSKDGFVTVKLGILFTIKADHIEPQAVLRRWMVELTDSIAWLETLRYAHSDLRPDNLLLDNEDHLILVDFDYTTPTGTTFDGYQPPYARVQGNEVPEKERGTFGYYGSRTEQFSIGSIMYYVTRGYEVYDPE